MRMGPASLSFLLNKNLFLLVFLLCYHRLMKNFLSCILVLFLTLTFLFECSAEDQRPVVRIGAIVPLTGGMAHAGTAFKDAAEMALGDISPTTRFKYELIVEDDQLQAGKAASAAKKLLSIDKVDALISTWSYGGVAVAPLAEKVEKIHFGIAWDHRIVEGTKFSFLNLTPPREIIKKFYEGFHKKGYRKIVIIGWQESGSLYFLDEAQRLSQNSEFEIVQRIEMGPNEEDYKSILLKASKLNPDVYLVNLATPGIDVFMKQARELGIKTPITAMTGFEVAGNIEQIEGLWYVSDSTTPDEFTQRFLARYKHDYIYGIGNYYDSVRLIEFLFEKSHSPQKPTPIQLLETITKAGEFRSVFGPASLGIDRVVSYEPVFRKVIGGKRVTVGLGDL